MADIYQNTTLLEQALAKANALPDKPAGTVQITTNGTHDIAEYDKAEVNVPTGAGAVFSTFDGGVEYENVYFDYSTDGSTAEFTTSRVKE